MATQLDISVVIPFKNHAQMTIQAVVSLFQFGPSVKEVILVSNNSSDEELNEVQLFADKHSNVTVLIYNHPFNYQKVNNWAVKQSTGSHVLFMNNDIELRTASKGLIERMFKKASLEDAGIIGCTLLFGDEKTIQHAGVYLMPEGQAEHMYVRENYSHVLSGTGTDKYPYDILKDIKMTAVTGALQLVERKKFDAVGGFDERFILCGGDVDLCIRLNKKGFQTWFVGEGYALHKESISRKFTPIPAEDFYYSYLSYITGYDPAVGDPFLPEITKNLKVYGA